MSTQSCRSFRHCLSFKDSAASRNTAQRRRPADRCLVATFRRTEESTHRRALADAGTAPGAAGAGVVEAVTVVVVVGVGGCCRWCCCCGATASLAASSSFARTTAVSDGTAASTDTPDALVTALSDHTTGGATGCLGWLTSMPTELGSLSLLPCGEGTRLGVRLGWFGSSCCRGRGVPPTRAFRTDVGGVWHGLPVPRTGDASIGCSVVASARMSRAALLFEYCGWGVLRRGRSRPSSRGGAE